MNLAYVAGLFDGEGCVNFYYHGKGTIVPRIFITNTNKELLEDLKNAFGGWVGAHKKHTGWKQGWQWTLSNSKAVAFLEKIQPWVRIKDKQILLAFCWCAVHPSKGNVWNILTRDLIFQQSKWLNHKGSEERGIEPMQLALAA